MTWWPHLRLEIEAMFASLSRHGSFEVDRILADRIEWMKEQDRRRGYANYLRKRNDPGLWVAHIKHHVAYQNHRRATDPEWRERERLQRRESAARCKARREATVKGRFFITPHAVRQYIERVRACSYDDALADLIAIAAGAHFVKPAKGNCELWRGARTRIGKGRRTGGIRLIVGPGEGELPALITVLGEHDDATAMVEAR